MPPGTVPFPFGDCKICHDRATGIHYGVATCEGCKGFFKRSTIHGTNYKCFFGGSCKLTPQTRNRCKSCRLKCCHNLGMSMDAVKMGRIPKIDRERALQMERKRQENSWSETIGETPTSTNGNQSQCSGDVVSSSQDVETPTQQANSTIEIARFDTPEKPVRANAATANFPLISPSWMDRNPVASSCSSTQNGYQPDPSTSNASRPRLENSNTPQTDARPAAETGQEATSSSPTKALGLDLQCGIEFSVTASVSPTDSSAQRTLAHDNISNRIYYMSNIQDGNMTALNTKPLISENILDSFTGSSLGTYQTMFHTKDAMSFVDERQINQGINQAATVLDGAFLSKDQKYGACASNSLDNTMNTDVTPMDTYTPTQSGLPQSSFISQDRKQQVQDRILEMNLGTIPTQSNQSSVHTLVQSSTKMSPLHSETSPGSKASPLNENNFLMNRPGLMEKPHADERSSALSNGNLFTHPAQARGPWEKVDPAGTQQGHPPYVPAPMQQSTVGRYIHNGDMTSPTFNPQPTSYTDLRNYNSHGIDIVVQETRVLPVPISLAPVEPAHVQSTSFRGAQDAQDTYTQPSPPGGNESHQRDSPDMEVDSGANPEVDTLLSSKQTIMRETMAKLDALCLTPPEMTKAMHEEIRKERKPHYMNTIEVPTKEQITLFWELLFEAIPESNTRIIGFCKSIPGIMNLDPHDQEILMKNAYFDIWMVFCSTLYAERDFYLRMKCGARYSRWWMNHFLSADLVDDMITLCESLTSSCIQAPIPQIICALRLTDSTSLTLQNEVRVRTLYDHFLDVLSLAIASQSTGKASEILLFIMKVIGHLKTVGNKLKTNVGKYSPDELPENCKGRHLEDK